ncbi:FKBP-type peptidyl-prolyl cis-trans isomerase [Gilliamella apicola]|uniref:Peptidyl-prolyl cis-trans isomerase n=2 Tax=Gilliamella apicola TaxID=1196095 RepID=A0A556RHL6_9GAMM|nr:FKBP-type peptidyl-prolyl cis-trans isomerase [Gilliamella apicola]
MFNLESRMKSFIKMTLVSSAIVLALAGCDDKKTTEENKAPATTTATANSAENTNATESKTEAATAQNSADKATISTDAQKEAYALGSSFANYMKSNLEQNEVTADQEYLISGFNETMRGASQLSQDEVKNVLDAFGKRIQEESQARFEKQKTENTAAGEKYREDFAKQEGVIKTKSGLMYKVINEGTGRHPTAEDTVIVHYVGTLTDGRTFDSSYDRNEPATFPLNGVIKGWTEGIQLIGVGGKIKLVVPPELAYGDQSFPSQGDKPGITPASTLVFEVELLGIDSDKENNQESTPAVTTEPEQTQEQPAAN